MKNRNSISSALQFWRTTGAAATMMVLAGLLALNSSASAGCTSAIGVGAAGTCGIQITASGCYKLLASQHATDPAQDCISIAASSVFLKLGGLTLTGLGAGSTGDGIHVLALTAGGVAVSNVTIEGRSSSIGSFNNGVEIDASNVVVDAIAANGNLNSGIFANGARLSSVANVQSNSNGAAGIDLVNTSSTRLISVVSEGNVAQGLLMAGSTGNTVSGGMFANNAASGIEMDASNGNFLDSATVQFNTRYGIWLNQSRSNRVSNSLVRCDSQSGQPFAEIYLGCAALPSTAGTSCSPNPSSSGNRIEASSVQAVSKNCNFTLPSAFGLLIDTGDSANISSGNTILGALTDSATDLNSSCGSNIWFANTFTTANQGCIQ